MTKTFMNPIVIPLIPQGLITFLETYHTFLIAGHKEPDGDCIGSSLALSFFLERLHKNTVILSAGPFKRPEVRMYERLFLTEIPAEIKKNPDGVAVIIVDCSNKDRTGSLAEELEGFPSICIDHHATNTAGDSASLVYAEAPSTTFLIQGIIEKLCGTVTQKEADMLFFGLCTDTGFFRHLDDRSAVVQIRNVRLRSSTAGNLLSPERCFHESYRECKHITAESSLFRLKRMLICRNSGLRTAIPIQRISSFKALPALRRYAWCVKIRRLIAA